MESRSTSGSRPPWKHPRSKMAKQWRRTKNDWWCQQCQARNFAKNTQCRACEGRKTGQKREQQENPGNYESPPRQRGERGRQHRGECSHSQRHRSQCRATTRPEPYLLCKTPLCQRRQPPVWLRCKASHQATPPACLHCHRTNCEGPYQNTRSDKKADEEETEEEFEERDTAESASEAAAPTAAQHAAAVPRPPPRTMAPERGPEAVQPAWQTKADCEKQNAELKEQEDEEADFWDLTAQQQQAKLQTRAKARPQPPQQEPPLRPQAKATLTRPQPETPAVASGSQQATSASAETGPPIGVLLEATNYSLDALLAHPALPPAALRSLARRLALAAKPRGISLLEDSTDSR